MSIGYGLISIASYGFAILWVMNYAHVQRSNSLRAALDSGLDPEKLKEAWKLTAPNSLLVRPILVMGTSLFLVGSLIKWIVS